MAHYQKITCGQIISSPFTAKFMAPSSAAMGMEGDKLSGAATATAAVVAFTCFFALAISILLIKNLLVNKKRVKSCYLNTESKPQSTFKRVLADNSYSQFKHLKLQASDVQADSMSYYSTYDHYLTCLSYTLNALFGFSFYRGMHEFAPV